MLDAQSLEGAAFRAWVWVWVWARRYSKSRRILEGHPPGGGALRTQELAILCALFFVKAHWPVQQLFASAAAQGSGLVRAEPMAL
jgi:hypothetical protein